MNRDQDFPTEIPPASGDHIGRLLRLAGPRPAAPHEREARVKESVRAEWRRSVRGRRHSRWLARGGIGLAAAAGLTAMVGLLYQPAAPPAPVVDGPIGVVEAVSGTVRLQTRAGGEALRIGDAIPSGALIDTGVLGRAAVRLSSGPSLRLDRRTRLRGLTASVVSLESGAVYFDSGVPESEASVEIHTLLGVVHDIGTLFEVRLDDGRMRIRVREGAVNLDREGRLYDAGPGVELTVDAGGALSRRSVPIFGPEWEWILAIGPTFELEGRTLDVFLDWISRETGWSPRFVDPDAAAEAGDAVLHGSVEEMTPAQALDAVLPTCGLVHRLDGGILLIQAEGL